MHQLLTSKNFSETFCNEDFVKWQAFVLEKVKRYANTSNA